MSRGDLLPQRLPSPLAWTSASPTPSPTASHPDAQRRFRVMSNVEELKRALTIPTLAESGYTRFELVGWLALFAPKGTPAEIIVRLNAEVNKIILESADLKRLLASIGMEPPGGSPEQLGDFHKAEIAKWAELVRTTGVRLN